MANTEFGTNDTQTVKRWSTDLAKEAIGKTFIGKLMKRGTDNTFIKVYRDLEKAAGDQIKHHMRSLATGGGKYGSQMLSGFEEEMKFPQDTLTINQLRQAHKWDQMSQQRVTFDLRSEARDSLSSWYAQAIDTIAACKLAGTVGDATSAPLAVGDTNLVTFDGNSLRTATTNHTIANGGASGSTFEVNLIDQCVAKAKTLRPRIEPVNIDGGNYYACLMRPESVYQLRIDTGDTNWRMIQARAAERGSSNPIFSGALGIWNNTILYEWEYLPADLTSAAETCYSVFLGKCAGAAAFGGKRSGRQDAQLFSWVEETEDYDDKMGVGAASIFGFQRTQYDANDDGTATDMASILIETEDPSV